MKFLGHRSIFPLILVIALCLGFSSCKSKKNIASDSHNRTEITVKKDNKHSGKGNQAIIKEAMTWIGTPYAYGKSDKGIGSDCSGLVMKVYLDVDGIKIPRNSAKQAEFCKKIPADNVVAGDLVFFATGKDPDKISHVGIMMDDVSFIHASSKKGVVVSRIDTPYYIRTFKMFGRIPRQN